MKRLIVVLVVAGALLAPTGAFASGVVIKVQRATHLVVVTRTPSSVLLVHTSARVSVGERIALQARRLHNSTFAASHIAVLGRVRHVRCRGLLLSSSGQKLMVSAGGAVIALHRGAHTNDSAPRPGSVILATVTIGANGELDEDDATLGIIPLDGLHERALARRKRVRLDQQLLPPNLSSRRANPHRQRRPHRIDHRSEMGTGRRGHVHRPPTGPDRGANQFLTPPRGPACKQGA